MISSDYNIDMTSPYVFQFALHKTYWHAVTLDHEWGIYDYQLFQIRSL
jgi:hypothetical protein